MSIVVFGSINMDLTTYGARLPQPGETTHGDRYAIGLGGKGCNQAVAASQLGAETTLVGRIGDDDFGKAVQSALASFGIATEQIFVDPESSTGLAVIGVNAQAENCITVIGGANLAVNGTDVSNANGWFENADILLLQLEIPLQAGLQAATLVRKHGGRVILDPAPAPAGGLPAEVFSQIDVITPNETETEALTGINPTESGKAEEAAAWLRRQGVPMAVIKLGAEGVYFQGEDAEGFVPPFKVNSIDSVAAGDCFNGGLAYALAEDYSTKEAVRFAAACGALATTKAGAASSAPRLQEVLSLLG